MMKHSTLVALGVTILIATGVTDVAAGPQSGCLAGKNKCVSKKAGALLQCEWRAETPGKAASANFNGCIDGAKARFDGGSDSSKGCFETLENKTPNDCVTFDDTASVEMLVDACVARIVEAIDPGPIDQSKCAVGKKKCAAKLLRRLLKCHQKAETIGKPADPNFNGCLDKATAKFAGGSNPTTGCFEKLESKSGNDCLPPVDNTVAVEGIIDTSCAGAFVPAIGGCPSLRRLVGGVCWSPGTTTGITIQSGGLMRTYNVRFPPGYDGTVAVPLVLDLHGSGVNGQLQEALSGFKALADANGFIVAYPDGKFQEWNAGLCCDPAASSGVDDVGFARDVVADLTNKANIDVHRVYATGLSNGGGMVQRLACEAADVFAAAAPVAFPLVLDPLTSCHPARPISVLHFAGLTDGIIPYEGGVVVSPVTGQMFVVPSAQSSFAYWAATDACGAGPPDVVEDLGNGATCATYTSCAAGVAVGLCSIHGSAALSGHILYANTDGVNVAQRAWDFLSGFTLPTP
jgi:poly(3-hydroxybutyrate) depolymerase